MKKLFAILAAAILMFSCAAAENTESLANPWTEVESLEVLNETLDMNLQLPGVMGITDTQYRLMTTDDMIMGEVRFTLNGRDYVLRGAPEFDTDISGIYVEDGKTAFEGVESEACTILTLGAVNAARWMDIAGQYVLFTEGDTALDEETFADMVDELMTLTRAFQPVVLPDGTYDDEVSGRAHAEVKALGNDTYAIEIHWADSAFVDYVWTMTAEMTEDGLLTYGDCVETRVETAEDGTTTEQQANLIPDGYFVPGENAFSWDGAAEENCRGCVFTLVQE